MTRKKTGLGIEIEQKQGMIFGFRLARKRGDMRVWNRWQGGDGDGEEGRLSGRDADEHE